MQTPLALEVLSRTKVMALANIAYLGKRAVCLSIPSIRPRSHARLLHESYILKEK
jgi:hypothetical protein